MEPLTLVRTHGGWEESRVGELTRFEAPITDDFGDPTHVGDGRSVWAAGLASFIVEKLRKAAKLGNFWLLWAPVPSP